MTGTGLSRSNTQPWPNETYARVLLKISGESFSPRPGEMGIGADELGVIAGEIAAVASSGVEVAVVVGGGNMIRGANLARQLGIDQSTADYMGMLGTVMNGMALKEAIETAGVDARLMTAISMPSIAEDFIRKRALRHLAKGRVVILAAGTGNPFFTTDTCAALRATELNCNVLLKATKVDGVYSADPNTDDAAIRYDTVTFQQKPSRNGWASWTSLPCPCAWNTTCPSSCSTSSNAGISNV